MQLETQLSKLKKFMADGDFRSALKLAAGWARLGEHRDAIQRGGEAAARPEFYRQIGKNPDELVQLGIQAIRDRYNLK